MTLLEAQSSLSSTSMIPCRLAAGRRFRRLPKKALVSVLAFCLALGWACVGPQRAQPVRELRLVFATPPLTLDPQRHREDLTRMVLANFYEGLATFDRNLQIRPCLAVEWTNPSDAVCRLRLRRRLRVRQGAVSNAPPGKVAPFFVLT